jgi:hypothetical protein
VLHACVFTVRREHFFKFATSEVLNMLPVGSTHCGLDDVSDRVGKLISSASIL